jgi:CBS domain-containing protein
MMWDHDCGCIPIRDGDHVVGMITDRDICMAAHFKGKPIRDIRIEEAMSRDVAVCRPGDPLETAEAIMMRAQVRRLPVTDASGRLVGILSLNDIARALSAGPSVRSGEGLHQLALTLGAICAQRSTPTPRSPS